MVFTSFSLVYVFNQLVSTLEDSDGWVLDEHRTPRRSRREGGDRLRKMPGAAGRQDSVGVDRWQINVINVRLFN